MVFNSWTFVSLMLLFIPLYLLVRHSVRLRNVLLVVTSYVFYGWWDWRFLILLALSTAVDYAAALGAAGKPVQRSDILKSVSLLLAVSVCSVTAAGQASLTLVPLVALAAAALLIAMEIIRRLPEGVGRRRAWLVMSLVTNLGILGFFKYFNFFADSVVDVFHAVGLKADHPTLEIILPVGLSFYTFQAISRTIDSYRGQFEPKRSIIDYAAYHAFFPQLVAGPIERASHLMPQFESVRPITVAMVKSGAMLFAWGLFQKVVVADNVAALSDVVFDAPGGKSGAETLIGVAAFSIQIYCDFAGYSNMARGFARIIGFDLMKNFDLPYFSRSPQEFWRRWHISLSRWLRDYLYIPLGGSRGGEAATYRNLMTTMVLGGLWHGAAWTFVAWGAFHGLIQVAFRVTGLAGLLESPGPKTAGRIAFELACWALTMALVAIGWVFFRARTFGDAWTVLANSLSPTGYGSAPWGALAYYAVPLALVEIWQRFRPAFPRAVAHPPFILRYTAALYLVLATVLLSAESGKQFIYFDF